MVEFALVVPLVLLLALGILNFGYAFGQQLSLNQAAREGARKAVVSTTANTTDIAGFVQNATGGLITNPESEISVTTATQEQNDTTPVTFGSTFTEAGETCTTGYTAIGGQLQVTATYRAKWLVPTYIPLRAPTLRAVAVFRCEVVQAP